MAIGGSCRGWGRCCWGRDCPCCWVGLGCCAPCGCASPAVGWGGAEGPPPSSAPVCEPCGSPAAAIAWGSPGAATASGAPSSGDISFSTSRIRPWASSGACTF